MSIRTLVCGVVMCSAVIYAQSGSTVTPADYLRWRTELRNWGRWGPNDQKGTANLITPQKVQSAARLVRSGDVVSLAGAVPQQEAADVGPNQVFRRTTNAIGPNTTTDTYQVSYHGLSLGHTDAFCHFFMDGQMYNGYSVKENITPETGCKQGSIMGRRDGIVTRGVLYDMPQLKGVEWIEPGTPITRADLEAWEKRSGVRVGPGDVIVLYVGPLEAPRREGAMVRSGGGLLRRHDSVLQGARHLVRRARHEHGLEPASWMGRRAGDSRQSHSPRAARLAGRGDCGEPRSRKSRGDRSQAEALRVHADVRADPVEGGSGSPVNPSASSDFGCRSRA